MSGAAADDRRLKPSSLPRIYSNRFWADGPCREEATLYSLQFVHPCPEGASTRFAVMFSRQEAAQCCHCPHRLVGTEHWRQFWPQVAQHLDLRFGERRLGRGVL